MTPGTAAVATRRVRDHARTARRLVEGGWRLGPRSTLGALGYRMRGAHPDHPPGPATNSGLVWLRAGGGWDTTVWLHDYWLDAYGIEGVAVAATVLGRHTVVAPPGATTRLRASALCARHGVALPFEGQLLLEVTHERLVAGRPVQVHADYTHPGGQTGVHGQYGLMAMPTTHVAGNLRLDPGPGSTTWIIVGNHYVGPGGPCPMRAGVTVADADGRSRHAELPVLPPLGVRRVVLHDVFGDLTAFLGGRPGQIRVRVPCPGTRITAFTAYPDGRVVASHATDDRVFDRNPGLPGDWTATWPVAATPLFWDAHRDTTLTFINRWGPVPADQRVTVRVYDRDGVIQAGCGLVVPRDGVRELALGAVCRAAGLRPGIVALAESTVEPAAPQVQRPVRFDVVAGLLLDGRRVGEVQTGSEIYNAPPPTGMGWPDVRRTRTFARVDLSAGSDQGLFLAHPLGAPSSAVMAATALTLIDGRGRPVARHDVRIPPHGFVATSLDAIFPDGRARLGPGGVGALRVRSVDARLFAYHTVRPSGRAALSVDHLMGG
jgi:hypothetical protein